MAFNMSIQDIKPVKISHKWITNTKSDLEATLNEALLSCLWDRVLSYEDYVGISHQIQAIELGYTDF